MAVWSTCSPSWAVSVLSTRSSCLSLGDASATCVSTDVDAELLRGVLDFVVDGGSLRMEPFAEGGGGGEAYGFFGDRGVLR
jgi:hypothetical protein